MTSKIWRAALGLLSLYQNCSFRRGFESSRFCDRPFQALLTSIRVQTTSPEMNSVVISCTRMYRVWSRLRARSGTSVHLINGVSQGHPRSIHISQIQHFSIPSYPSLQLYAPLFVGSCLLKSPQRLSKCRRQREIPRVSDGPYTA